MGPEEVAALLLAGNYVTWGLKPGAYLYDIFRFSRNAYNKYLRPKIEKMLGLQQREITLSRLPDNKDGKIVLKFSNVSIVDFEQIKEQFATVAEGKTDLSSREEAIKQTMLQKKSDDKTKTPEEKPAPETRKTTEYFDVELVINNPNIRIGEIDYSDWSKRKDFEINVTKVGTPLKVEPEESKRVLASLQKFTKLSLDLSLTPEQTVRDTIAVSQDNKPLYTFQHGNATKQETIQENEQKSQLDNTAYLSGLITLASDQKNPEHDSILENYYRMGETTIHDEIAISNNVITALEKESQERKQHKIKEKLAIGSGIIGLLSTVIPAITVTAAVTILLGGTITLVSIFLIPETAGIITGLLRAFTTAASGFLSKNIFTTLFNIGTSSIFLGAITKGITDYKVKKEASKETEKELKEAIETKQKLEADLENVTSIKKVVIETFKDINDFEQSAPKNKTLVLPNKNIGDHGTTVICHYLSRLDSIRGLELANNGITAEGAKELANSIKNAQIDPKQPNLYITTLDLTGNPIGKEGVDALKDALQSNPTVTTLQYDDQSINPATVAEIDRQLLENWYLHGGEHSEFVTNRLFKNGEEGLKIAAMAKLENNFGMIAFPPSTNQEISALAQNVTKQNFHLQQLSSLLLNDHPTLETDQKIVENCSKAFELNPSRCSKFFTTKLSSEVKEALAAKRKNIASSDKFTPKQRRATLAMFDLAVEPNLGFVDSVEFKQYQLKKLLLEHPADLKQTFAEFMEIYQTIPKDQAASALELIDKNALLSLVKEVDRPNGGINVYTQLRSSKLTAEHKSALLELCFKSDASDYQNKVTFITNILSNEKIAAQFLDTPYMKNFRKEYLDPSLLIPQKYSDTKTYKQIKEGLLRLIKDLKTQGKTKESELLDQPLQKVLQKNLIENFTCLRSANTEDFEKLQNTLNNNFDLRQFSFPEGAKIDDEVKTYITKIIERNKSHNILPVQSKDILQALQTNKPKPPPSTKQPIQLKKPSGVSPSPTSTSEKKQREETQAASPNRMG